MENVHSNSQKFQNSIQCYAMIFYRFIFCQWQRNQPAQYLESKIIETRQKANNVIGKKKTERVNPCVQVVYGLNLECGKVMDSFAMSQFSPS